jgi:hypothetical protein
MVAPPQGISSQTNCIQELLTIFELSSASITSPSSYHQIPQPYTQSIQSGTPWSLAASHTVSHLPFAPQEVENTGRDPPSQLVPQEIAIQTPIDDPPPELYDGRHISSFTDRGPPYFIGPPSILNYPDPNQSKQTPVLDSSTPTSATLSISPVVSQEPPQNQEQTLVCHLNN